MRLTILLLLASMVIMAQTGVLPTRTASLTWTDDKNPSGTQYNIYRTNVACTPAPATTAFTKVNAAPVSTKTYSDAGLPVGNTYCYTVTATLNGVESDFSNLADAVAKPFSVVINLVVTAPPPQ